MGRYNIRAVLFLLISGLLPVGGHTFCRAASIPTRPVYTNKPRFRIPFRYDAAEMQRLGAGEVRLYASADQGRSWRQVQSVAPQTARFNFAAPGDGQYWFAVRTVDARGQLHPGGQVSQPGLMVVVDATKPRLQIRLRQLEPGKVDLQWSAQDEHLDLSSLNLEYMQTGVRKWNRVGIVPQANGRTSWSVPKGGFVAVRGSVKDLASNIGTAQSQVQIEPATQVVPQPKIPDDYSRPIAIAPPMGMSAAGTPASSGSVPSLQPPGSTAATVSTAPLSAASSQPMTPSPASPRDATFGPAVSTNTGLFPSPTGSTNRQGVNGQFIAWGNRPSAFSRGRVVRSKKFQIRYKFEDVGPSGVGNVELYITENNGGKWYKYGNDPDRRSPYEVKVPREGTYGFSLRVRSGVGLAADPPQPGEKPAITVTFDNTPPVARLLPLRQGRGAALNKILIQWTVTDAFPAERSVSLSFAPGPNGPWRLIIGGQPNNGRYLWTIGPRMPQRIYVRLTAQDAAGNSTSVTSPQPVTIDLIRPSARIVDVQSADAPGFQ